MKFRFGFLQIFALSVFLMNPAEVFAAIPPGEFILKKITTDRLRTDIVQISTDLGYGDPESSTVRLKQITTWNPRTRTLRSRVYGDGARILFFMERQLDMANIPIPVLLLLGGDDARLTAAIALESGTAQSRPMIKRWNGRPAWIIGDRMELWVEKDAFNPLAWNVPGKHSVEFVDFNRYQEFPYPRQVLLKVGGDTVLHETLEEIRFLTEEQARAEPMMNTGWTDQGASASALAREMISSFYTYLR